MRKALSWLRDLSGGRRSDDAEGKMSQLDEGAGFIT